MSQTPYREPAAKRTLPLVDDIRVATPCDEPWDEMIGDTRSRFCTRCAEYVYDLSAMTRYELESFVGEHAIKAVCVRFYRRADGRVLTTDCRVGVEMKWRKRRSLVARLGAFGGTFALFGMLANALSNRVDPDLESQGKLQAPRDPQPTTMPTSQSVYK